MILNDLSPGEGISEESLAAEFGVSRTPVREALVRLEAEGIVASEANRGFSVAPVSIERIRSYFEAARRLHLMVFEGAVVKGEARQIRRMHSDQNDQKPTVRAAETHYRFIESVAKLSQNDFLRLSTTAAETYHCCVRTSILRHLPQRSLERANAELALHRANIVAALDDQNELPNAVMQMIEGKRVFILSNLV